MLNKDKYKNVLLDFALDSLSIAVVKGEPKSCICTQCDVCDLHGVANDCRIARHNWANSEYEEKVDWTKVKKDTPVLVRNCQTDYWNRRYFAEFKDNHVYVYNDGCTSWSASRKDWWVYAKLSPITNEKGTN
nr:MAG TPA: hypothetical protein [Caudoviricetes sp.]